MAHKVLNRNGYEVPLTTTNVEYDNTTSGLIATNAQTAIDEVLLMIPTSVSTVKHEVKLAQNIAKGKAVYVSGSNGTNMLVSKADNTTEATSSKTLGLLVNGGSTNDFDQVVTEGLLAGLDTSTATLGDAVWLGTNGNLIFGLANKPVAPAHLVYIGAVTRVNQNNGEIFVHVQNGFELEELHNVLITNLADKDVLSYDLASGLWKNGKVPMPSLYTKEIHVDGSTGNNTTGNGTLLNPYETITKGISMLTNSGVRLVVHPGTYNENITISNLNVTISSSQPEAGGLIYINGDITVTSTSSTASVRLVGISMTNLNYSGTASLFVNHCKVNGLFTKSGTGYVEAFMTDLNAGSSITGAGITLFKNSKPAGILVNNALANVATVNCDNVVSVTNTAGTFWTNGSTIYATTANGNAITSSAGSTVIMSNSFAYGSTGLPTKISIAGNYSIQNSIFDKVNSTLGTNLGAREWFDTIGLINVSTSTGTATVLTIDGNGNVSKQALDISAISGLQTALDNKQNITTFTSGTTTPSGSAVTNSIYKQTDLNGNTIAMYVYDGTTWVLAFQPQVQSDFTEADTSKSSYIKNKPSLAPVATSGDYSSLLNKPTIPDPQIQSDYTQTDNTKLDFIKNKPDLTVYELKSNKGINGGYVPLNPSGKIDAQYINLTGAEYKGTWNASTNTPTLSNSTGTNGWFYYVDVAGTQNLGAGSVNYAVGDIVIYDNVSMQWKRVGSQAPLSNLLTVTQTDFTNATTYYYGGTNSAGDWQINKWDNANGTKTIAKLANNPTVTSLATAWSNRLTLIYS